MVVAGLLLVARLLSSGSKIAEKMRTKCDADNLHNADKCRHMQTE
jgi:hypothetical protein